MVEATGQVKNGHYLRGWWQGLAQARRRRWTVVLALLGLFWLAGAWYGMSVVAGIVRLEGLARPLMALAMGGFSFLWGGLKALGAIAETTRQPNLLWVPMAMILPATLYGVIYLLDQPPNPLFGMEKKLAGFADSQGRTEPGIAARELAIQQGVPLAVVADAKKAEVKVGLDYAAGEGHVLVTAPTRAGKGLHLTETLLNWPGAALVVDPKGEQLARTAAWRGQLGPIYRLPGHQLTLADYYSRLLDRDDVAELHAHLLRPWESRESIFAEKAMSLFTSAGLFALEKGLDPVRVLLDLAESDPVEALTALETVPVARRHVRVFTNGAGPDEYRDDKFVTSAYGNLTTRLATYQKHIETIAPAGSLPDPHRQIPPDWAGQNGTIYLTYSLQDLQGVGGVVAAIIAAMLRYQMQRATGRSAAAQTRLLVAIDELPAVGLRNVANYLATAGGYGITLLLYVQSIAQLGALYGPEGTQAILANCAHQLWYPPAEYETATAISQLYGLTLKVNPVHSSSQGARQLRDWQGQAHTQLNSNQGASWSWQEGPALLPSQALALTREQVLVATQARSGRRHVFIGRRLNPVPLFGRLPSPARLRLPRPVGGERHYLDWAGLAGSSSGSGTVGRLVSAGRQAEIATAIGTVPFTSGLDVPGQEPPAGSPPTDTTTSVPGIAPPTPAGADPEPDDDLPSVEDFF